MKKYILPASILLVALSFGVIALFADPPSYTHNILSGSNQIDSSWNVFQQNSPTSSYGNRYNIIWLNKDITRLAGKNIYFDSLVSRNDGAPTSTLWLNSSGKVCLSPASASGVTSVGLTSSDFTISGSPVTSSGSITANLNTSGVSAGTYDWITVNSKGIATGGANLPAPTAIASGARNFNQAYQLSVTKPGKISVSAQLACSLTLLAGTSGQIILEISPNGSTGWIFSGQISGSNTGSLTVGLNTSQITGGQLSEDLPAGYFWRLRTNNITGTPTYTFNGGNERVF